MGNELKINGLVNIDGMEFHDIEGGFGEGKKAMLVKEIANIHKKQFKHVNEAINKNKERFKNNIDVVDLKSVDLIDRDLLKELGFSNSSIANAKNIYLLSERGYSKLLKILEDDIAWEQYDKLVDGYFNMREKLKKISPKQQLQLTILNGGELEKIQALGEYTNLITEEATRPLLDKIEEDKPLVTFADRIMKKGDNILVRELAKIISDEGYTIGERKLYTQLREWGYIFKHSTEPTQRAVDNGYFVMITRMINTPYGEKETFTTKVTPKGQIKIVERILKENNIE